MKLTHLVALQAVVLVTALPMSAQANSIWHPAPTEEGFTYHPDHWKSTKTRAQVMAEVEVARKDGTLALMARGLPVPIKSSESPKTRAQVIEEMRNELPEARRERLKLYSGGQ
ncbi:TPA: DUF4148 domain-containing protein [Pseudomonas aeruginosa]|uniref:DUF4148 domain-containing protein n=1 Tax=Cupriavidus nantongensis TaxID=1796606 RepID=A0A142JL85_9BURK|nr:MULTISPECIES: DUF4148 domain-containing protein [Pseudomonadota]AMR78847.1 hypothetical protein A2G96_14465 [Cupriavidus nantongensis]MCO1984163.1 DUF4148 domain-containing protein [Pseudomonas aeruginosa]MCW3523277.1 DUF4148 domain-containing protein [Burkholderia cenocepacia]MCW3612709.1 DUF4148 domain-containing protein [Burkholderia cenocepacia]MCW3650547.1 DUF4148 domain-containing protein [Burkholderia cenocepacia]